VQRVDVLIVGGGPAGLSTALFLAHAAPELTPHILVLEKERYPREKFCAGAVGARADRLLASIGVVVDTPSVPLDAIALRAMGRTREVRGRRIGRVVRRIEYDHELASIARARGVRVLDGHSVDTVLGDSRGCSVLSSAGRWKPRVVVGADGVSSIVRRALGFPTTRYRAQALEVDTEPVPGDLGRDVLLFDVGNRSLPGYYWDFPTLVGGRELMCRGVYLLKTGHDEPAVEIQSILAAELRARGLDLARYEKKRYAERGFDVALPLARPGALLVGEAAGIDPVTGEGIAQAVQYGALAGNYLARKLRDRDLTFTDWSAVVQSSRLGRDLFARHFGVRLFYGPPRAAVERFLLETPEFLRVGMQHFAGERWSKTALARSAFRAFWHTSQWALGARVTAVD
jgi:flavin-dependent dehydrogenase